MQLVSIDSDSVTSTRMSKESYACDKLPSECVPENTDLDKALALTGYGRFHYGVVASCAFCLISVGLQNSLSAYVLPAAHCELHLKSREIGFINAAFLVGGTCSSFLWGVVADLTGRKKLLVITLLVDVVITVLCALMQDFVGLVICRFFNGFFIGAPGSLTFTYLAEFHAPRHRAKSIYYSGVFYTLSSLFLPTAAWVVLPLKIEFVYGNFVLCSSWRVFLALLAVPELIAGIWILYLPETPKYLATREPNLALRVLKRMYSLNTGRDENTFPVKNLLNHAQFSNCGVNTVNCRGKIARVIEDIYNQIHKLFRAPLVSLTLIISGIMFSNMFGFFGLGLWLPELLTRFQEFQEKHPNVTATLGHLTNLTKAKSGNESCFPEFENALFESTMAMGVSALIGNVLSGWCAGKFEHKVIPLVTMFFGAISAGSIYWMRSSQQNLVAASVFQATMSTANVAIGSVIVELFPTSVNAIAICTVMFAGRVGAIISNVIFGFLMDLNCEIAVFLVAAVLLLGAFLCLLIPCDGTGGKEKEKENMVSQNKNNVEVSVISVTSM